MTMNTSLRWLKKMFPVTTGEGEILETIRIIKFPSSGEAKLSKNEYESVFWLRSIK